MTGPLLLIPGPLTTSPYTRGAMEGDYDPLGADFTVVTMRVREEIVEIADAADPLVCVPLATSGTGGVEAMLGSVVPRDGRVLVLVNGRHGQVMADICARIGRSVDVLEWSPLEAIDPVAVDRRLAAEPGITHVAMVHCETTTGLLNPLAAIAEVVAEHGRELLVDAMSSFGALSLDGARLAALATCSSACLEGVPGVALVLARQDVLVASAGNSPSLALDLHDQWRRFEHDGKWRFTPPTHAVAALDAAIAQHQVQGGRAERLSRYQATFDVLVDSMADLGLEPLVPPELQAPIVALFPAPDGPDWMFDIFDSLLLAEGFAVDDGALPGRETFRVGCIGQVYPEHITRFAEVVKRVLIDMGLREPDPPPLEGGPPWR